MNEQIGTEARILTVWEQVRQEVIDHLPRHVAHVFIEPLEAQVKGASLVLVAPNAHIAEVVQRRYLKMIAWSCEDLGVAHVRITGAGE